MKRKTSSKTITTNSSYSNQSLQNTNMKIIFFYKKIFSVFFTPLKQYIFTQRNKPVLLTIIILALFGDLFFTAENSDLRFFGISGLFLITALFYKLASKFTFILCLFLLVVMYISFLLSNASAFTEKASVWIVLFMIAGIIQQWNE